MSTTNLAFAAFLLALAPALALGAQAPDRGLGASARGDDAAIFACPMSVANAPAIDAARRIIGIRSTVEVGGVSLLAAPVTKACLSSGFGLRGGRRHAGVDYYAPEGSVLAAADGVIREVSLRADFGNMLLIEHADRVFTRYAHLAAFSRDFAPGDAVEAGDVLGAVGMTGEARAPHLHYEILIGAYDGPAGSFGLTALDPIGLSQAAAAEERRREGVAAMSTP